jgi:hypothetical protein
MPLPPGIKVKAKAKKKPAARPGTPAAIRPPVPPGVGGGRGKGHTAKGGQRDPKGNNRPGINARGKKVGSR